MTAYVRSLRPVLGGQRSRLMLSCAAAALASVALPTEAFAQAFQGTETVVGGTATRTITTPTTETITIGSPTATINWSPNNAGSGTIDFLPAGNVATFTNDPQTTADFTVLNRILPLDPSRPIALNGHVISQLQNLSQNVTTGGNVWFYSPGGIVVGSSAVFDVGGLLLSANDLTSFTAGSSGFTGDFAADPASNASIQILAGAQINALANNSYVAVVAPRVVQEGTVRVDGAAAYVAAQGATMTLNQGLFDIEVDAGTGDSNGIVHTGTTGGPASTGAGDNHGIYMVAVPKNQALTALLSGNAGFDTASGASIENGVVVLSANYNVAGNNQVVGDLLFWGGGANAIDPLAAGAADWHINGGTFTSDIIGRASRNIYMAGLNESTTVHGDVTLIGREEAHIGARNGHTITIDGNATVSNGHSIIYRDYPAEAGRSLMYADAGSSLSIGGNATIDAAVFGGEGLLGSGGEAGLHANGGTVTVGGDVNVDASGNAGTMPSTAIGLVHGGLATIQAGSGGSIVITGNAIANADGTGATILSGGNVGGSGFGGDVRVGASDATLTINGNVSLSAQGYGGSLFAPAGTLQSGGEGVGGQVELYASDGGLLTFPGTVVLSAVGYGGSGTAGGNATGGLTLLYAAAGGTLEAPGSVSLFSSALGGDGTATGVGGDAEGGRAEIYTAPGTLHLGSVSLDTSAFGGDGSTGGDAQGGTGPGDSTGGGSFIDSFQGGEITATSALVVSQAYGGTGLGTGDGGDARGGIAAVAAFNGANPNLVDIDTVSLSSVATGGAGGASSNGGAGGDGGDAIGGRNSAIAFTLRGTIRVDSLVSAASGFGGAGGAGGSNESGAGGAGGAGGIGTGGSAGNIGTASGQGSGMPEGAGYYGSVVASANGLGGSGGVGGAGTTGGAGGAGGDGRGGYAVLQARGATLDVASGAFSADGQGGAGGAAGDASALAGNGGAGFGGAAGALFTTRFQTTDGATVNVGTFSAGASGTGGAGDQTGATSYGEVFAEVVGSSATLGSLSLSATGSTPSTFRDEADNPVPAAPYIEVSDGTLAVTGSAFASSGGQFDVTSNAGGSIAVGGHLTLISAGGEGIDIFSADGGQIDVAGTLSATATGGGDITIGAGTTAAAQTAVTAFTPEDAAALPITVADLVLTSANDISVDMVHVTGAAQMTYGDDLSIGTLLADGSIRARLGPVLDPQAEGNTLFVNGLVSAPTISLESGALSIEEGGQIGEAGFTGTLELIARSFGDPILIGGTDESGDAEAQYHLTQAEAERVEADTVTLRATSNTDDPAQVLIRDLTIQGSAGGGSSAVNLITAGSVRVEGDLAFIDAAATDALRVSAAERIEVITPDGSIRMTDAGGNLAGTLTLQSASIVVTDAALADQLADDPNFSGRDAALLNNSGAVKPAGYLEAGGIELLAGSNIFIQNSGTATEFAGLTVGSGGLLVGRYEANSNPDGTQTFSFTGTLTTADDVLYFEFTITAESEITLRTYSYAGGTNGAGEVIPSGGFDPILALFNSAGLLIDDNDDGGSNVPADPTTGSQYDTFLQALLPAGTYTVAVTAYSNFANGPNLSDGFEGGGNFNGRTPNFAFDVIGADNVTGPGNTGPLTVVAFGRMQNADGSFTGGNAFFDQVDFGLDAGVEYAEGSTFNNCPIGGSCSIDPGPGPVPEPEPQPDPTAPPEVTAPDSVLGPVEVIDTAGEPASENLDDGTGVSVNTSLGLIGTGPDTTAELLEVAVTSGGDTAQWVDDEECAPGDRRLQCAEGNK